jgi:hypothetical protein
MYEQIHGVPGSASARAHAVKKKTLRLFTSAGLFVYLMLISSIANQRFTTAASRYRR